VADNTLKYPTSDPPRKRRLKVIPAEIDPQLWVSRFRIWCQSPSVPIGSMMAALESKSWALESGSRLCPGDRVRLYREHLEFLKSQIAVRIRDEGGEWKTSALVLRSADGQTFTTHLPGG
jgi:hypothetical protein